MTSCKIIIIIFFIKSFSFADVLSPNGQIEFDVNSDGQPNITLNDTGLGVGTLPSEKLHVLGNAIISNSLTLGTGISSSNLNVNGSIGFSVATISSNTSLGEYTYIMADTSADNLVLTLPNDVSATGRIYHIKKTSEQNQLWIKSNGNIIDSINQELELTQQSNQSILPYTKLIFDGSSWYILEQSSDIRNAIASENLLGWWKLDDLTGTEAKNSKFASVQGDLLGGFDFSTDSSTGLFGNALQFDGANDQIEVDSNGFDPTNFTICIWFKLDSWNNYENIFHHASNNANQNRISIERSNNWGGAGETIGSTTTNGVHFALGNNTSLLSVTYSTTEFTIGTWYHIAVGLNSAGNSFVYVNGQFENGGAVVRKPESVASNYSFGEGWNNDAARFFDGALDDLRVYHKALSAEEILAVYQENR